MIHVLAQDHQDYLSFCARHRLNSLREARFVTLPNNMRVLSEGERIVATEQAHWHINCGAIVDAIEYHGFTIEREEEFGLAPA